MVSCSRGLAHRILVFMPQVIHQQPPPTLFRSQMIQAARSFRTTSCTRAQRVSKARASKAPSSIEAAPKSPLAASELATPRRPTSDRPGVFRPQIIPNNNPATGSHAPPKPLRNSIPLLPHETQSYAQQLAAQGPTTLFEGPSHFWMRVSSVTAAIFCASCAVTNYWNIILHPPEGIAWWVPHGFALICVCMGGMGGYFLLATAFIVRRIRVVPTRSLPGFPAPSAKGVAAKIPAAYQTLAGSRIALEVTLSRAVPFLPARVIYAAPGEVVVPFSMQVTPVAQRATARIVDGTVGGARSPSGVFGEIFRGFKRGLTGEGFSPIKIQGKKYKIDLQSPGGWLLENGKAMDRIVAVRPKHMK